MCGIIGIVGKEEVADRLVDGLRRMEYRGYDSAGVCTVSDGQLIRRRAPGKLIGLVRELAKSDPAEVARLAERLDGNDELEAALMAGLWDSRSAAAAPIARSRRGTLPRMGESLAVLVLASAGGTLTDDDMSVLARAAAGGGDLDPSRAIQAAWYYARASGGLDGAVARASAAPAGGN